MKTKKNRNRYKKNQPNKLTIHRNDYLISENNRITYIYRTNIQGIIVEIICVSLEIRIQKDWKTIIYYDSYHDGALHRHTYSSIVNDSDVADYLGVRKKGGQKRLLRWAIDDIKNNYLHYKKQFVKRCRKLGVSIDVEIY